MRTRTVGGLLGRRGLMAGAAAVVGAGIARLGGARSAAAGHNTNIAYDSQTVMHLDVTNTTAGSSRISSNISGTAAAVVLNNYPVGISRPDGFLGRTMYTTSNCAGVAGACESASGGLGVMGASKAPDGTGVYGFSGSVVPSTVSPGGTGVYASGPNFGVHAIARSAGGIGVQGSSINNVGVFGVSPTWGVAGRGVGIGVYGVSDSPAASPKEGVRGESTHGPGVYGVSLNNAGVFAESAGANIALFGKTGNGTAVAGQATDPTGFAGQFFGNVHVVGSLTVTGSFPKSAGVPHPDGSIRRMYCLEGPESAFEDWGRATLKHGQASVKLDADFAALVTADDFSVFPVPEGDCKGLYVASKSAGGFEVRELGGGTSDAAFSYRILAKRKDLVGKAKRLEKIELPHTMRRGGERGVSAGDALPQSPQRERLVLPKAPTVEELNRTVPNFSAKDEDLPGR